MGTDELTSWQRGLFGEEGSARLAKWMRERMKLPFRMRGTRIHPDEADCIDAELAELLLTCRVRVDREVEMFPARKGAAVLSAARRNAGIDDGSGRLHLTIEIVADASVSEFRVTID